MIVLYKCDCGAIKQEGGRWAKKTEEELAAIKQAISDGEARIKYGTCWDCLAKKPHDNVAQ